MNRSFTSPSLKKQRLPLNPRILISMTLVLAIVLIISAALDYWGAKRELSHVLKDQSQALITALEKGSQNAIASYDLVQDLVAERLLNNARLLEELDYTGQLDEPYLQKIAEQNNIFRINVYDKSGNKDMASFQGFGWGASRPAPEELLKATDNNNVDELVLGFRSSRFGQGQRFAVAKKRRKGGVIVLNIDSNDMLRFRKSIGLGKLISDIGKNEGIEYIALQDTSKIIIGTAGLDSLSTIRSDPILYQTLASGILSNRFVEYRGQQIFEIIHLFDSGNGELLRIGLSTQHLREAQKSALTRVALSSVLLLIFGVVGASWAISNQNIRSLKEAYDRIETYTGSMLENMTDGVVAIDKNGYITLINKAAEDLFGLAATTLIGKPCATALVAICTYLKSGLETARSRVYPEEKLQAATGVLTVFLSVNVIRNKEDRPDIVFAVIRDMTDLKKLEENLNRKDRITAMGQLASGVAHEIRNPLNAIGMIAQRLKLEFQPAADAEEYVQLTSTMFSETRRLNGIIQQFLQFARPGEPVKSRFFLSKLIDEVKRILEPLATAKGVRISQQCENDSEIYADGDKLKQALLNLGQNAIDACSDGGEIKLSCTAREDIIRINVEDSGAGIAMQDRDKIFNLYYTSKEKGTGIGLSLVQQIISQHDGTIEVRSQENVGSIFTISLPKNLSE